MPRVTMPQLGESVAEGTIGKWLKKPGDSVAKYEPLLEVITDKVNAEVPSPYEGILKEILVEEGATVPNNAEIAVIEEAGEAAGEGAPEATGSSAGRAAGSSAGRAAGSSAGASAPPTATEKPPVAPVEPMSGPAGSDERREPATDASTTASPMAERSAPAATERPAAQAGPAAGSAPAGSAAVGSAAAGSAAAGSAPASSAAAMELPGREDARMTPAVRRLLREHDLSPAMIVGTGGGGRISREDVLNYVEAARTGQPVGGQTAERAPATARPVAAAAPSAAAAALPAASAPTTPPPTFAPGEDEQVVPWTQMRKGVAKAMLHSKTTVPHAYTTVEADVTGMVRLRDSAKAAYQASEGLNLSYVPFVVKAVVEGLRRHPYVNAQWSEDGLVVKRRINVGVAIAVDNGLIVPVIHDADQLSINGLNRAVQELSARARNNRLQLNDLQDGTITVNNTGWFGSVASQSIVNTPQIAIVNMEAIVKRPVVRETPEGDVIAVRSIMNVPVAFDHRATDGAQIGRFVADVKAFLEAIGPDTPIY